LYPFALSRRGGGPQFLQSNAANACAAALNEERDAAQCRVDIPQLQQPTATAIAVPWFAALHRKNLINACSKSRHPVLFARDRRPQLSYKPNTRKKKGRSRMNNRQVAQV